MTNDTEARSFYTRVYNLSVAYIYIYITLEDMNTNIARNNRKKAFSKQNQPKRLQH
jgi:hypothetical protein